MELTLRYSLQKSNIKPNDITGEYARLQVNTRPEMNKITISNEDYQMLIQALAEGRLIGLQNEAGLHLGQFLTSLSGGVVVKNFTSPSKEDIRASFKPMRHFLNDIRELVSFERVPTVRHNPVISDFIFTDNTGGNFTDEIPISTNGLLQIAGANFIKDGMEVSIIQDDGVAKVVLTTQVNSGAKSISVLVSNTDIDTASGFKKGKAQIIIARKDNTNRQYGYSFEITE